jgi:hypothetical protein
MSAFEAWLAHLFDRRPDELGSPAWYHLTAWGDETGEQPTEWNIRYEGLEYGSGGRFGGLPQVAGARRIRGGPARGRRLHLGPGRDR